MRKMWFGNVRHAQWVPCPASGAQRSRNRYSDTMEFTNGGAWVDRSFGNHSVYSFDFPVADSSTYEGIEAFDRFADGEYGSQYLHFVDPMRNDENLMNETWSSPGLAEIGHKLISQFPVAFTETDQTLVSTYGVLNRTATFTIPADYPTWASNPSPFTASRFKNSRFTLIIPPGYTLHLGAVGGVTGNGALVADIVHRSGNSGESTPVPMLTTPGFTLSLNGDLNRAVTLFVGHTNSEASTVSLTSIYAQILRNGVTPTLTRHIPGKGHSGLSFSGSGRVENYIMADRHLVGAALQLTEVEPWE